MFLKAFQSRLVFSHVSLIYSNLKVSEPIGPPNERKPPDPSITAIPSDLQEDIKAKGPETGLLRLSLVALFLALCVTPLLSLTGSRQHFILWKSRLYFASRVSELTRIGERLFLTSQLVSCHQPKPQSGFPGLLRLWLGEFPRLL